ncbi:MAG: type II toxin-antitoxin system VapC family toxin [Acidimicrobiales bacterium]
MTFVDTSFWFSLQDRLDRHHQEAAALAGGIRRARLITSNQVVGETWTTVRRRLGHAAGVGFLDRLLALPNVEIIHVDEAIEGEAWAWLRRHDERDYSFVDASSFAMMRRRRVREALAFDGDFTAAGFVELRA